jgi:7,8-dihydroneopterin aldolase/epimerase/oxygenase
MLTIFLDKAIFHGLHGLYSGEPLVGGDFEVSVQASFDDAGLLFDQLSDTVSYVSLFEIVKKRMSEPTPLLEKVARLILDDIHEAHKMIRFARISIYKLQPPIPRFQGRVGIEMTREY